MFQASLLLAAIGVMSLWMLYRAGWIDTPQKWIISLVLLTTAFLLRAGFFPYETLDYQNFLKHWVQFYRTRNGFAALNQAVGNYNIPYLYFLALFSYSNTYDLYLIKLLTIFFEPFLAYAAAGLVVKTDSGLSRHPLVVFFTVLFLPTVVLNGAVWGQCDAIYVALALLGIYYALDGHPVLSLILAALSFGFKLQAVFILPVYAVLLARGDIRWKHLPVFPLTYVLLVLPAVLAGRPFLDTLTLYLGQTGSIGDGLNYNSSSIYSIIYRFADTTVAARCGIIAAFGFLCAVLAGCMFSLRHLDNRSLLCVLLLISLGIPFFLPHMHDRYFFAADIVSLVLAFAIPELIAVPLLVQFGSLLGYHAYLKMRFLLPMSYGGYAMLLALLITICACVLLILFKGDAPKEGQT